jgi:hypothetical protein
MRFPIKLLGLAGLVGATAITAIAIDRKRQRLVATDNRAGSLDRTTSASTITDAELVGASVP